ncbi:MAG: hypothetical protein ACC663_12955, partial [Gammaproteobacteria bacterium]
MLIVTASPVWAHNFRLGFVAPMSGSQSEIGREVLDGFLLATTEEDAHPDESSDGHLGGLDSYVIEIDDSTGEAATIEMVEDMVRSKKPLFVTGVFSAGLASQIADVLKKSGSVLVNPVDSAMWREVTEAPGKLTTMSGESFNAAFKAAYGYKPNANVHRGYIAARLIASTVRSLPASQL